MVRISKPHIPFVVIFLSMHFLLNVDAFLSGFSLTIPGCGVRKKVQILSGIPR
jgi:hypothetical protein